MELTDGRTGGRADGKLLLAALLLAIGPSVPLYGQDTTAAVRFTKDRITVRFVETDHRRGCAQLRSFVAEGRRKPIFNDHGAHATVVQDEGVARLVDEGLARLLLGRRHRGRASLLDLLDLRAIGLEVDLRRLVEAPIGEARLDQFQFRRAQIERAQAAIDGQTERVEGLLLFGLDLGFVRRRVNRGGEEDEDSRPDHERAHRIAFSREFHLEQWPPGFGVAPTTRLNRGAVNRPGWGPS